METDSLIIQRPGKCRASLNFDAISNLCIAGEFRAKDRGHRVTRPADVFAMENNRSLHGLRLLPGYATDVVLFVKGIPEDPRCTKVGGQPFWPQEKPWPVSEDGSPQKFLAQFNFSDSIDILGPNLPAEILVVTVDETPWADTCQSFHWVLAESSQATDLRIPLANGVEGASYGVLHRTADYRDDIISATKIGGRPFFIQGDDHSYRERLLCQLGSFNAMVEVEARMETVCGHSSGGCGFRVGDGGHYYYFLAEDDTVSSLFDSH